VSPREVEKLQRLDTLGRIDQLELRPLAESDPGFEFYQVDHSKLVIPLLKAVQELSEQVDVLRGEIGALKA
jgi:hypothetical protein